MIEQECQKTIYLILDSVFELWNRVLENGVELEYQICYIHIWKKPKGKKETERNNELYIQNEIIQWKRSEQTIKKSMKEKERHTWKLVWIAGIDIAFLDLIAWKH